MTCITEDLDRICKRHCSMYSICALEHECTERQEIKKQIVEILKNGYEI